MRPRALPGPTLLAIGALALVTPGAFPAPPRALAAGADEAAGGLEAVEPVSPGAVDFLPTAARACPTFSWSTAADPIDGLALRVFELGDLGDAEAAIGREDGDLVLEVHLPAGATSWTPPLGRCLDPGGGYRWEVESIAAHGSARSTTHWFRVSDQPSPDEVERAIAIVRRALDGVSEPAPPASPEAPPGSGRAAPRTAAPATRSPSNATSGAAMRVAGTLDVRGLHSDLGELWASGDVTTPSTVQGPALVVGDPTTSDLRSQTLWAPAPGSLLLCDSVPVQNPDPGPVPRESPCGIVVQAPGGDSVEVPPNGELRASLIIATGGLVVAGNGTGFEAGQGITVDAGSWTAGGGSGFDSVGADGGKVDYDDNESPCPVGTVAIGARLFKAGGDQIGIQVKCSGT